MVNLLSHQQLHELAELYNQCLSGENMCSKDWGDFYALLYKVPHGPIANCRPLLNFHALWKLFSACMKQHVSSLFQPEVIPVTQFALWRKSSANDVLWVIHDHINDRWFHNQGIRL